MGTYGDIVAMSDGHKEEGDIFVGRPRLKKWKIEARCHFCLTREAKQELSMAPIRGELYSLYAPFLSGAAMEEVIANMKGDTSREQVALSAMRGDAKLSNAVTAVLVGRAMCQKETVGTTTEKRKLYLANKSMAQLMGGRVGEIPVRGEAKWHVEGTLFEALFDRLSDDAIRTVTKKWMAWVDDNITEANSEEAEPAPRVTTAGAQPLVWIERKEDRLLLHVGYEETDLDLFEDEKRLDNAVSAVVRRVRKSAQEQLSKDMLFSLDKVPPCKHCGQKRCVIFRSSTGGRPRINVMCYICSTATDLLLHAEPGTPVFRAKDLFNLPGVSEVDRLFKARGGDATAGLPLRCLNCNRPPDSGIVLHHCSNKYLCQKGNCSRKRPCKSFTAWMCLECKHIAKLAR